MLTARRCVELFHLVFLRALVAKGEDKSRIALKGGCNLRFFFGSVRYSEDIDLDVGAMPAGTLKNKIERLLRAPIVESPLKSHGVTITEYSAPKQTETTQRWKVGLRGEGLGPALRTKVEFSRRESIQGAAFEAIDREVLRAYDLTPSLATHYGRQAAVAQKIQALAGRSEPQARDIFDLNLLLAHGDAARLVLTGAQKQRISDAVERAMSISFDEYESKVVAFLDPDHAALYADRATWDAMQAGVVNGLEALR